jgi:hypothetical protein
MKFWEPVRGEDQAKRLVAFCDSAEEARTLCDKRGG